MAPVQRTVEDRLSDFSRDRRVVVLAFMSIVIGAMSSAVAYALVWMINLITNLSYFGRVSGASVIPTGHHLGLVAVAIPMVGGLIIGCMARFWSEKIRGHGIPEALEAILVGRSLMDPKIAALKPLASAISIGTGGPFGAEGPIIMTGGALASLLTRSFQLSSSERKALLVSGAAGGMTGIFGTPLAAILLSVELLLFEWKPRSLIPVAVSCATAATFRTFFFESGPLFPVTTHLEVAFSNVLAAAALGMFLGLASGVLTLLVYQFEDLFTKMPIHWMWWPSFGGLAVGIGGFIEPRALGVGYDIIAKLVSGDTSDLHPLRLLVVKALIWAVALGSGTSGGVLAPLLIFGGLLGAFVGQLFQVFDPGLWALAGMAAMMGGTMRAPLTATVFVLELTNDIAALPIFLTASVLAYAVTVLLMRRSILTEKVARRGHHVTREYSVDPLSLLRVGDVMDTNVQPLSASSKLLEVSDKIARHDKALTRHHGLLLVDEAANLTGIITRGDILRVLSENEKSDLTVLQAGTPAPIVAYADELVSEAIGRMLTNDIGRLPVVSRENSKKVVGYLGRTGAMLARMRTHQEENIRERGWNKPDV